MYSAEEEQINTEPAPRWIFGVWCVWIFVGLLAASALAVRMAIMTNATRGLLVATIVFGIFTGLIHLARLFASHPRLLFPAFFFIGLFVLWAVLGDKPPNEVSLTSAYVKRLGTFKNVRYVWGGETRSGIDCSGLARTALWQAMLVEGLRELNPRLLGPMLWKFWWRDMSASTILARKHGYTRIVGHADKLAGYDTSNLHRGDLAIAGGSSHVLIYWDKGKWIEANPDDGKVVTNRAAPSSKRPYFNMRVTFMRWWVLEEE